jgi:predicted lipase
MNTEIKIALVKHELQSWEQASYTFEVRQRVGLKAGNKALVDRAAKEMEEAEKIVDALKEELAKLEKEATDAA